MRGASVAVFGGRVLGRRVIRLAGQRGGGGASIEIVNALSLHIRGAWERVARRAVVRPSCVGVNPRGPWQDISRRGGRIAAHVGACLAAGEREAGHVAEWAEPRPNEGIAEGERRHRW